MLLKTILFEVTLRVFEAEPFLNHIIQATIKSRHKPLNFLGREAAKKQIQEAKAKLKANRQKIVTVTTEDFRASQSLKLKSRRIESDLFRAQKACRQLDMSKEITEPVEIWFWPKTIPEAPGISIVLFKILEF